MYKISIQYVTLRNKNINEFDIKHEYLVINHHNHWAFTTKFSFGIGISLIFIIRGHDLAEIWKPGIAL